MGSGIGQPLQPSGMTARPIGTYSGAPMSRLVILSLLVATAAHAQRAYPVIPTPLPDAEEIALALTAAPPEISGKADVYTIRDGKPVRIQTGTNGVACLVARDYHPGSSYPICYDAEGTRTRMQRELLEVGLRTRGVSEEQIAKDVAAAYESGALKRPAKMSIAYMLSPKQVIYSSPKATGVRVGAWWPHLMITGPDVSASGFGLPAGATVAGFSVGAIDGHHNELVVQLHTWSDGAPVKK